MRSPRNKSVNYRQPHVMIVKVYVHTNIKHILKSVFKMSYVCSNASSKTWTPLPDHFINEHLVEMFPLFDQACMTSAGQRHESGCDTHALQLVPNLACWEILR